MTKKPSTGNAFTLVQPVRIRPTLVSKAMATRVNKNTSIAAHCGLSKSQRAPR